MVKLAIILSVLVGLAGCAGAGTGNGSHVASASAKPVSAAEALRETQGVHPSQRELAEATRVERANATTSVVAPAVATRPKPAPLSESSSCSSFLHAHGKEQQAVALYRPGEVGQVAWGDIYTEVACKADPTTSIHFAVCSAIEDIRKYPGLEAGAAAEFRQSYPWCFE